MEMGTEVEMERMWTSLLLSRKDQILLLGVIDVHERNKKMVYLGYSIDTRERKGTLKSAPLVL